MNRLLIVDGSNLLFQMFFGLPARIVNSNGKAIQGTLGFIGALLKIVRMIHPTHIVVLFDGQHDNSRNSLDIDYKSNRPDYSEIPDGENPYSQLADVFSALEYLKIKYCETTDCETDDWIAGYAVRFGNENEIVISSFDSDFFQLVTDKVSVLRYRGEKTVLCTPNYIDDKFGIVPSQYADFKSLTGDKADNIKGADKVGPKTAALLLNAFGNLENIIANAHYIKMPSIRASVIRNSERLRTNYQLIKLNKSVSLPFTLDELQFDLPELTTNEVLKGAGLK